MLRAVLDTNVLIAARRSARGASAALLADLLAGRWRLVLSNTVLAEYEEVLKREAHALGVTLDEIDALLDSLCQLAEPFEPSGDWQAVLSDPADEAFAQLASESGAVALATFNLRHFAPARRAGIPIMTPAEFLGMLRATP